MDAPPRAHATPPEPEPGATPQPRPDPAPPAQPRPGAAPPAQTSGRRPRPGRRLRRFVRIAVIVGGPLVLIALTPALWLVLSSAGHLYTVDNAPPARVVIVFGAQLAPDGVSPMPFLQGRLDVAAQLVADGKADSVLVSGDGNGGSGDEIAAMTSYLVAHGVPADRIAGDPYGLDSYDTCKRAHDLYGVREALLVSQRFHLPRAVTLCRRLGIDASGVAARCDTCRTVTLAKNSAREIPAAWKALYDAVSGRPPAATAAPDAPPAR